MTEDKKFRDPGFINRSERNTFRLIVCLKTVKEAVKNDFMIFFPHKLLFHLLYIITSGLAVHFKPIYFIKIIQIKTI